MTVTKPDTQRITVDSRRPVTSDPAASPPVSPSHTVDSNPSGSIRVETLDLTANPPASTSLRSHTPSRIDACSSVVDAEALPVQVAVAGLLACSSRIDTAHIPSPTADPSIPASPESPSSTIDEPPQISIYMVA